MIQFKKIPPSKSALLLLLILTTNVCGFLRDIDHRNDFRGTRRTQIRYSTDLQPRTQNLNIRKLDIDREINEKDGNSERVYDRRSFRTGTIQRVENLPERQRSINLERSRDANRDLNNNRQLFTRDVLDGVQNTRDNRRYLEPNNHSKRLGDDNRLNERAVISRNRQYDERRSVDTSTDRRNVRDSSRRFSEARTTTESRFINGERNIREGTASVRREARESRRELPPTNTREGNERLNTRRLPSDRSLETRRAIRSVDMRDRIVDQRRLSVDRLERTNARANPFERRTVEDRRTSDIRNPNQESRERLVRTNSEDRVLENRVVNQRRSFSERLDKSNSQTRRSERFNLDRSNPLERRIAETRDGRNSENRIRERFSDNRRIRSLSEGRESFSRNSLQERDVLGIRTSREDRARTVRDQTRRESQEMSRQIRQLVPQSTERHQLSRDRVPDVRRTIDRSHRIDSRDDRRTSRAVNTRESRSDSTRYINENTSSRNIGPINRESTRVSRDGRREISPVSDRYNPLTADSRRYLEKIVSQRTTRTPERNMKNPTLNLENNFDKTYTSSWASIAKVLLAAFLIGQIFVNSSKTNKARFHNIFSLATSMKEKIQ